jgi:hypothetical protein
MRVRGAVTRSGAPMASTDIPFRPGAEAFSFVVGL